MEDTNSLVDRHKTINYTKHAPLGLTREKRGWYTPDDDYLIGIEFRDTGTDLAKLREAVNETAKITMSFFKRRIVRFYDNVPMALAFIDRFADLIENVVREPSLTTDNLPSAERRRAVRQAISEGQEAAYVRREAEREHREIMAHRTTFDLEPCVHYRTWGVGDVEITPETPAIVLCGLDNKPKSLKSLGATEVKTWRNSSQRVAFFPSEKAALSAMASISDTRTVIRYETDGLEGEVLIPWQGDFDARLTTNGSHLLSEKDTPAAVRTVLETCGDAAIVRQGILLDHHDATLAKIACPQLRQVELA